MVPLGPSVGGLNTTTATGQLVGKVVSLFPHGPRSDGMVLEEFRWFGGILEEFMREKHCFG